MTLARASIGNCVSCSPVTIARKSVVPGVALAPPPTARVRSH